MTPESTATSPVSSETPQSAPPPPRRGLLDLAGGLLDYKAVAIGVEYEVFVRLLNARQSAEVANMARRALPPIKMKAAKPGAVEEPEFDITDEAYRRTGGRFELISRCMAVWYALKDVHVLLGQSQWDPITSDEGWSKLADALSEKLTRDVIDRIYTACTGTKDDDFRVDFLS